jgi:hypothetical protein
LGFLFQILGDKCPDYNLGLAYLLAESNGLQSLAAANANSSFGLDYPKLVSLSRLGLRFCHLKSLLPPGDSFKQLLLRSAWGRFISSELKIAFKEAFSGGKTEQQATLNTMIVQQNQRSCSVANLVRFCDAFDLCRTENLLHFVRASLAQLEPRVEAKEIVEPEGFNAAISKVQEALGHIDDSALVDSALMSLFNEVSPYNYEVLGFLIERLDRVDTGGGGEELVRRASQLFGFLLEYDRVAEPGEVETDAWLESTSSASQRPLPAAIARRRLPLSWLVKLPPKMKFKLLRKEFTLDSFRLWTNIARALKLQPDNICIMAVQNALGEKLAKVIISFYPNSSRRREFEEGENLR